MKNLKSLVGIFAGITLLAGCGQTHYVYPDGRVVTEKEYIEETTIHREFTFTGKIFEVNGSSRLTIEEFIDAETNNHYGLISGQGWSGWYSGIISIPNPEIMEGPNGGSRFSIKERVSANFENKPNYTGCVIYDSVADAQYCFIEGYGYISGVFELENNKNNGGN